MLILVPTDIEAKPLIEAGLRVDIVGVGPVEAAIGAMEALSKRPSSVAFLVGLAGAYPDTDLLCGQLVLATEEHFADLGVCYPLTEGPLCGPFPVPTFCDLKKPFLEKIIFLLQEAGFDPEVGPLVTVSCVTRDYQRARRFRLRYDALAENMEGFAVARVAQKLGVTLIELRAISNLVAYPEAPWEVEKALNNVKEALLCLRQRL